MCIIIDASAFSRFLTDEGKFVREWVSEHGKIVLGGKLSTELMRVGGLEQFHFLSKTYRVRKVDPQHYKMKLRKFRTRNKSKLKNLRTNDQHILTLSEVAECNLLYTCDKGLISVFSSYIKKAEVITDESKSDALDGKSCR